MFWFYLFTVYFAGFAPTTLINLLARHSRKLFAAKGEKKSLDKPTVLTCPASNTKPTVAGELRAKPTTWSDLSLLVYVA